MNTSGKRFWEISAWLLLLILSIVGTGFQAGRRLKDREFELRRQMDELMVSLTAENERIAAEKARVADENERLRANNHSMLTLNTRLQKEQQSLSLSVAEAQKDLDRKTKDLHQREAELIRLQEAVVRLKQRLASRAVTSAAPAAAVEDGRPETVVVQASADDDGNDVPAEEQEQLRQSLNEYRALVYYNLGVFYSRERRYKEAIEAFKIAIAANPVNADAHYNLALIYQYAMNDIVKARDHYRSYIRYFAGSGDVEEVGRVVGELEAKLWIEQLRAGAGDKILPERLIAAEPALPADVKR